MTRGKQKPDVVFSYVEIKSEGESEKMRKVELCNTKIKKKENHVGEVTAFECPEPYLEFRS